MIWQNSLKKSPVAIREEIRLSVPISLNYKEGVFVEKGTFVGKGPTIAWRWEEKERTRIYVRVERTQKGIIKKVTMESSIEGKELKIEITKKPMLGKNRDLPVYEVSYRVPKVIPPRDLNGSMQLAASIAKSFLEALIIIPTTS